MPQINRIRVNNVKYNFGTQFYDDFMMRFSCRNSIYDLANGGGKSVLMLLLLQNLIPNCTLDDKQPVEKLFRTPGVNTVIHSLIEWKLDACDVRDGYRYMTTGFCARKGKDNSEDSQRELASIEYFNYCIFYKEFGDNDIKNLPLSNGSERVTYNGLKAYLRDLEKHDYGVEVHIFERKGDYQNFISNYGLHESQWEIIRGINKTEGHVRTYFENSYKTTRKVVEDLLIEEIIEKSYNNRIRNGEADDDEMARTLLDIKDKLIELAKRRGEIAGYDRQMELLDEFAGGLGTIGELYDRKERTADGLVGCLMACRRELAGKKEQLENLENTYASLDEEYDVASAGAARADLVEEYKELDELNSLIEETIAARNAISDRSAGFKEQIRLNDIALEYRDYTDAGAEYDKLKELIANRSKDDEEIIESMHRLAALKYRFYTEKRALNLEGLNRAEETAADIKSEYEAEKEKVRALFAGMSSEKGIYDEVNSICLSKESSLMAGLKECSLIVADALGQAYEDNGNDKNYASEYAVTKLTSARSGNEQTIVIGKREGGYKEMPLARPFTVKVLSSLLPQSVTVNGVPAEYRYSAEDFALLVDLPELPCNQEKVIKIIYPSGKVDMNGLLGASKRIARSMEQLKYRISYIVFKEEFGKMGSLNEAVMYAPSEMPALIADFWKSYHELPSVLERQGLKSEQAIWFLQSVCWGEK